MATRKFQPNQQVSTKTDDQVMTVEGYGSYYGAGEKVECVWKDAKGQRFRRGFLERDLIPVNA